MKRFARIRPFLASAAVSLTLAGCGIGTVAPIRTRIDEANRTFDAAEAVLLIACEDEAQDRRMQIEQKMSLYDDALRAYREIVKAEPNGEYALRALLRMSEIYKKRREWDKVIECYESILTITPSGYYAERARSAIADARKYRRLIEENRSRYRKYSALYAQESNSTHRRIAAQALYDVANGYEQLGDYRTAIANYQRVAEKFPGYHSAWIKILEIYYYKLFDYGGGSPVYTKILEMYSGSSVSSQAIQLMRKTTFPAHRIRGFRGVIESLSDKNTKRHGGQSKLPDFDKNFFSTMKSIVRTYKTIAQCYKELGNYPGAISTYRELADRFGYKFTAVDAHRRICVTYASRGQIDQAIDAFQNLFDYSPESERFAERIYQNAVANPDLREFSPAYEYFKIYTNIGRGLKNHQEAEKILRQSEMDEDGDGYKNYVE